MDDKSTPVGAVDGVTHDPQRSRGERREFADVVLAWASAVESMRTVFDGWASYVPTLQKVGATLDGVDRARKIVELLKTCEQMRETEDRSIETRGYLDDIATRLKGLQP